MGEHFLRDLAIVMVAAAITTVVFHRLRLPVVLGYLLAGFLVGPRTPPRLVADEATIQTLSSLGVILLMFGVGLQFRLKRVVGLIPTAGLTALVELSLMVSLGYAAGRLLGWSSIASFFAGGVVAISSTMVVAKVYEDHPPTRDFREFLYAVLVFEDLAAVLLLTVLTAIGTGGDLSGQMFVRLGASLSVVLFAMLAGGMLVVPRALRLAGVLKAETMMVVGIGLCFGMAALAEWSGFSVALGAFLAGCLVAEAGMGKQVEKEVRPVRDLFGAIFFVAVGMQFDLTAIFVHWPLVLGFSLIVMIGKIVGVSVGAFLAGRGVQPAVQTAMSMAQIGEFGFIIAAVGLQTGAVPPELYAAAIAVSAITAFTTPWYVRGSGRLAQWVDRKLPPPIQTFASLYGSWIESLRHTSGEETPAHRVRNSLWLLLIDAAAVLAVTLTYATFRDWMLEFLGELGLPGMLARVITVTGVFVIIGPFVVGLVAIARRLGIELAGMAIPPPERGVDNAISPRRLLANTLQITTVLLLGIPLIAAIQAFLPALPAVVILLGILALLGLGFWKSARDLQGHIRAGAQVVVAALAKQSRHTETHSVDLARRLLPGLGDFTSIRIADGSEGDGKTLGQLNLRGRTGATIVALLRGDLRIAFPEAGERLQGGDLVALTGSHEAIGAAEALLEGGVGH